MCRGAGLRPCNGARRGLLVCACSMPKERGSVCSPRRCGTRNPNPTFAAQQNELGCTDYGFTYRYVHIHEGSAKRRRPGGSMSTSAAAAAVVPSDTSTCGCCIGSGRCDRGRRSLSQTTRAKSRGRQHKETDGTRGLCLRLGGSLASCGSTGARPRSCGRARASHVIPMLNFRRGATCVLVVDAEP